MIDVLITAAVSYIGTNIDDLFINALFFTQADSKRQIHSVVFGKHLGIGCLVLLSLLGTRGLQFLAQKYIGLLGVLPIALGLKEWIAYQKKKHDPAAQDDSASHTKSFALNVMLVTIANGADNIGIYIPLFAGYTPAQTAAAVAIFALMTVLWCCLSKKLTDLPAVETFLLQYKHIMVPVVFVALGIYIITKGCLFS